MRVGIGFNALRTILDMLGYRKLCARLIQQMLILDHKKQRLQACDNLQEWYGTMGNFLDSTIMEDEI
jgi:hypothetical protein